MRRHTYRQFGSTKHTVHSTEGTSAPHSLAAWPKFKNVAELGMWWFGGDEDTGLRPPVDIRTAVVKTRWYLRKNDCEASTAQWETWLQLLQAHFLPFQYEEPNNPAKRLRPGQWRCWVGLDKSMPGAVQAGIAESAVTAFFPAVSSVQKIRLSWKWGLPLAEYSIAQDFTERTINQNSFWTALIAVQKAKKNDFTLLSQLWHTHDQRFGLPIAVVAMIYLPKTETLKTLLTDFRYFREDPIKNGGVVLGMELVHRLATTGWLPETPPPQWDRWCLQNLNAEVDRRGLLRAFQSQGIPWTWKYHALKNTIAGASATRVNPIDTNHFMHIDIDCNVDVAERIALVKDVMTKFSKVWDGSPSVERDDMRSLLVTRVTQWLPEMAHAISLWIGLDLDSLQALQTIGSTVGVETALPGELDTPFTL